jgi:hypothetical protein
VQDVSNEFRFITRLLQSPSVVTGAGITFLGSTSFIRLSVTEASLGSLQILNLAAFAVNVVSVSIPGRLDGEDAAAMTKTGSVVDSSPSLSYSSTNDETSSYSPSQSRTLIVPSSWAFVIWAPIYIGEALFCCYGQFVEFPDNNSKSSLAAITGPFSIACCIQSLWCASFRPSYFGSTSSTWKRFVSVGMLAGTAYSLFQLHSVRLANPNLATLLLPMTLHSGWTTAATLVNFNGSLASLPTKNISDTLIIAAGHASAVAATMFGCFVGVQKSSPTYAATVAWALAACSTGISSKEQRLRAQKGANGKETTDYPSERVLRAMSVQQRLCQAGAVFCLAAAATNIL